MKKYLVLLLGLLILFVSLFGIHKVKVKKIVCQSQFGPCSQNILQKLEEAKGKRLIFAKRYIENILQKESLVLEYSTRYRAFQTYEVFMVEKKPAFSVTDSRSDYLLMSLEGDVLDERSETALPKLIVTDLTMDKDKIIFSGNILYSLFSWKGISLANIKGNSLYLTLDSGDIVIAPLTGDVDVVLGSLRIILSWLNKNPQGFRIEIDLRYKNPVIRQV